MPLELRDLATSKTFEVPNEGLTFGREGGKSDVQVKDMGVSKSHARVYFEAGAWFLEDLGSANGTYLGADRLQAPMELMPNDVISMSKTRFEVVRRVGEESEPTPPPAPKPSAKAPPKGNTNPPKKVPPKGGDAGGPRPSIPSLAAAGAQPRKMTREAPEASTGDGGGAAGSDKGIGYFVVAVPKAIAFYLAAIPLMLVNPKGTILKGIADQKHEPKGRMELIAYALPPNLFSAAVGFFGALIVGIVTHSLSIGAILPIVPLVVAVVVSGVTGFIWHPVLGWLIRFLKGESDDRSRTNYFLMVETAATLLVIPSGLAMVLGLVPLWPVRLLAPLISVAASGVMAFLNYQWFGAFNVVKWFRTVLLVLGIASAAFGVLGAVSIVTTRGGGTITVPTGEDPALAAKKLIDAQDAALQAVKDGEAAVKDVPVAVKDGQPNSPPTPVKPPPPQKDTPVAPPIKEAPPPNVPEDRTPPPETPSAPVAGGGYPAFAQMRDSVEKRITDDPTLLKKTQGLLELYRDYSADAHELDAKYQKLNAKKPAEAQLNKHLRDADLYGKDEGRVKKMYGLLNK